VRRILGLFRNQSMHAIFLLILKLGQKSSKVVSVLAVVGLLRALVMALLIVMLTSEIWIQIASVLRRSIDSVRRGGDK
jgi:hypothetical protein